ncbi:TPA: hypothetical protein QDB15_000007 [Burkholderia vietnamiensis]|uniref:Uncharacterized protein n=2 Tax=Burkholderiaceae TaxID=119060 RepID=A0A5E5P1K3_9BURK|nr:MULTISPECIES: hypothetical protein [Burkholderiaceae]NTX43068.1 hypothetical protein [Burkholderia cepacia]VVG70451.1 hypothetical protein PAP18089_01411 [Pandoraea apista]HDR9116283.1 hypothetical protein [Burkholderia vietnamiensis]HDR9205329.1 hypothetical protein [Burkholderia vietnamiensis]
MATTTDVMDLADEGAVKRTRAPRGHPIPVKRVHGYLWKKDKDTFAHLTAQNGLQMTETFTREVERWLSGAFELEVVELPDFKTPRDDWPGRQPKPNNAKVGVRFVADLPEKVYKRFKLQCVKLDCSMIEITSALIQRWNAEHQ